MIRFLKFLYKFNYIMLILTVGIGIAIFIDIIYLILNTDINMVLFIYFIIQYVINMMYLIGINYIGKELGLEQLKPKSERKTLVERANEARDQILEEIELVKESNSTKVEVVEAVLVDENEMKNNDEFEEFEFDLDDYADIARASQEDRAKALREVDHHHNIDDLATLTVAELKDMCKEAGLTGYTKLRKPELIEALEATYKN